MFILISALVWAILGIASVLVFREIPEQAAGFIIGYLTATFFFIGVLLGRRPKP